MSETGMNKKLGLPSDKMRKVIIAFDVVGLWQYTGRLI